MRRTEQAQRVAAALLANPDGPHWGYPLGKEARVRSGVLYPILQRMLDAGWLTDGWEPQPSGRPACRYYTITPLGHTQLAELANGDDK